MMNTYTAKPEHAYMSIFFLILCLLAGKHFDEKYSGAFWWGAFFFGVVFCLIAVRLILEGYDEHTRTITDFMIAFSKLPDDESRSAVGLVFPTLRYRMKKGVVRELFEDTNVPIETFRVFLQTSNDKYISPERDWQSHERPHWAWIEIYTYLCERGYVFPNSAAGNISHQWKGESFRHLAAYWLPAGRKLADMTSQDVVYQE